MLMSSRSECSGCVTMLAGFVVAALGSIRAALVVVAGIEDAAALAVVPGVYAEDASLFLRISSFVTLPFSSY